MKHLEYLTGRTRLACIRDGLAGIREGDLLPMRTTVEEIIREGKRDAADGTTRRTASKRREMIIELTAPDGTLHRFHTDPVEAAQATAARRQPAGREAPSTVRNHPITTFITHFHVPVPAGTARPYPKHHALLDLLEAITTAATAADT